MKSLSHVVKYEFDIFVIGIVSNLDSIIRFSASEDSFDNRLEI